MEVKVPKRNIQTNHKDIRLCPEAFVANFNEQNDLRKVSIDELPAEHRKLNNPNLHSFSKDTETENICKYFFGSLLNKPSPQISYPILGDYADKLLRKLDKVFDSESTLIGVNLFVFRFGLL